MIPPVKKRYTELEKLRSQNESLKIRVESFEDNFREIIHLPKRYEKVFKNHNGFLAHKWIHFFYIYDLLFAKYLERNEPVTFMEIGVAQGGSLEIWKKYLPENSLIYGVDINPNCNEIKFSENIFFHLGSASDRKFMEETFGDIEFDIILDDGSHICDDVIETFKIMFPRIKDGGSYIVEDLLTSYRKKYGGGIRKKGSSIEYFKGLVESVNFDYVRRVNTDGYGLDYSANIENITFYDSICAIKKYASPKTNPFKSVVSGEENYGKYNCYKNEREFIKSVKNTFMGSGCITNKKDILQTLLDLSINKYYLEIGVSKGTNFKAVKAKYKVGVDPIQPSELVKKVVNEKCVYHPMTSDAFFDKEKKTSIKFDVIFVDGLHEYGQAYRDIVNSLEMLAPDGVIVVHDCKPKNEVIGLPPNIYKLVDEKIKQENNYNWTGDVWKAIVHIRSFHYDLFVFTLDYSYGCAVITKGKPESMLPFSLIEINAMSFDDLAANYNRLLNLKDINFLYSFIANKPRK